MTADIFEYYEEIKDLLQREGCVVEEYKEINSGLQFNVIYHDVRSLIRVYESKKGLRLDLSQIRDEKNLKFISGLVSDGRENSMKKSSYPEEYKSVDPEELIGTDESGKGDYFGPLIIAGVYTNEDTGSKLKAIGVADSKKLTDKQIALMAGQIKELCPFSTVVIGNEKYNELYEKIRNLNRLLAWGHARAIENMLGKVRCDFALSDQFGDPALIKNALMDKGKNIILHQRPRAEENTAVAAASILARNEYVLRMRQMEDIFKTKFPKGASSIVVDAAREFVREHGKDKLKLVAKLHFKTTLQL